MRKLETNRNLNLIPTCKCGSAKWTPILAAKATVTICGAEFRSYSSRRVGYFRAVSLNCRLPGKIEKVGTTNKAGEPLYLENEDGCWVWQRSLYHNGYGYFWNGKSKSAAHRHFYEHYKGPIPDDLQLDHKCRNRACVNPDHLEPVTGIENTRRGKACKLNPERVVELRRMFKGGVSPGFIAERFGITKSYVYQVGNGRGWAGIDRISVAPRTGGEDGI